MGRIRTSTWVLLAIFLGTLVLYAWVKPPAPTRGEQPGGRTAERLAVADTHALTEADAAPPRADPVGHGVPAPDGHAAPDRDAAADRRADVRVPDGHPGAHPVGERVGERVGSRLTDRPVSAAGRPPRTAWAV